MSFIGYSSGGLWPAMLSTLARNPFRSEHVDNWQVIELKVQHRVVEEDWMWFVLIFIHHPCIIDSLSVNFNVEFPVPSGQ